MPPRRAVESLDAEFSEAPVMPDAMVATTEVLEMSTELATLLRHHLGLAQDAELPTLDTFLSECGVLGKPEDLQWLVTVCCQRGETRAHLNLGRVRLHIQRLKDEADTAMAKMVSMGREGKRAEQGLLSMDEAADLFYQHCYPDVQECLDIAVEHLQQPRSRIILAALGHYKDELHGVDVTNALEVHDMVPTPSPRDNVTPLRGQTQVAFLQRECPVCSETFQPAKDKPKQLYCRQACGDFAYATVQTWAFNAAAYEGMDTLPQPDPYTYGIPLPRREAALAWQAAEVPKALDDHRRRLREQRVRGV